MGKEEKIYIVYPGSEKLDLAQRIPVTITTNRATADNDVEKYGEFGEVVTVNKSELVEIIEKW